MEQYKNKVADYKVVRFEQKTNSIVIEIDGKLRSFGIPITDGMYPEGQNLISLIEGYVNHYRSTVEPVIMGKNPEVVYALVTSSDTASRARAQRNLLLRLTDWTQANDCSLPTEAVSAWSEYRTALKNVPQQPGFPDNIVWPRPVTPLTDMYGRVMIDEAGNTTENYHFVKA
jgi:hypothetical protein